MGPGFGYGAYGCLGGLGGGFGMMFFGIIIVGVIIYLLLRGQDNNTKTFANGNTSTSDSAIEIAKTRLAKGEITSDEYENIKNNLK